MTRFKLNSSYAVVAPIELITSSVERCDIRSVAGPDRAAYKLKYHLRQDVLEWLEKHFSDDTVKLSVVLSNWSRMYINPNTHDMVAVFVFQDECDAALFKLTWG